MFLCESVMCGVVWFFLFFCSSHHSTSHSLPVLTHRKLCRVSLWFGPPHTPTSQRHYISDGGVETWGYLWGKPVINPRWLGCRDSCQWRAADNPRTECVWTDTDVFKPSSGSRRSWLAGTVLPMTWISAAGGTWCYWEFLKSGWKAQFGMFQIFTTILKPLGSVLFRLGVREWMWISVFRNLLACKQVYIPFNHTVPTGTGFLHTPSSGSWHFWSGVTIDGFSFPVWSSWLG